MIAAAAVPTGMRRAGRAPTTIFAREGTSSRGAGRGLLGMGAVIAMVGFCLGSLTTVSILYCLFASDPFSNQATNLLESFVDSEGYNIDPSRAVLPDSLFGKVNNELACGALIHISSFKRVPRPAVHPSKYGRVVHVVTSTDMTYLPGLFALINSTIVHTDNPVAFHIVTDMAVAKEGRLQKLLEHIYIGDSRKLRKKFSFQVVGFDPARVLPLLPSHKDPETNPKVHANAFNFARFYFHELLPKVPRAVYLDPDTIMLGNVVELYTVLDNTDLILAASQGRPHTYRTSFKFNVPIIKNSFNPDEPYFNAGVMVIDLARWRKANMTHTIESWMKLHQERPLWVWGTQPPLMAAFYRKYLVLDESWNVRHLGVPFMSPHYGEFMKARVLHWNGKNKPWLPSCKKDASCLQPCWQHFAYSRLNTTEAIL